MIVIRSDVLPIEENRELARSTCIFRPPAIWRVVCTTRVSHPAQNDRLVRSGQPRSRGPAHEEASRRPLHRQGACDWHRSSISSRNFVDVAALAISFPLRSLTPRCKNSHAPGGWGGGIQQMGFFPSSAPHPRSQRRVILGPSDSRADPPVGRRSDRRCISRLVGYCPALVV